MGMLQIDVPPNVDSKRTEDQESLTTQLIEGKIHLIEEVETGVSNQFPMRIAGFQLEWGQNFPSPFRFIQDQKLKK